MQRIRIGKDLDCRLTVLTNGETISLEEDSITLVMVYPDNRKLKTEIQSIEDNVIKFHVSPSVQRTTGIYGFEVWKNIGSGYQTVCDKVRAFELVPLSIMEGGVADPYLETEMVEMTANFSNEYIVIDNLDSYLENVALSANMGRVLKEMVESEATTREEACTTLQTSIDNEAKAREDADTALQSNIDKKQDKLEYYTEDTSDETATIQIEYNGGAAAGGSAGGIGINKNGVGIASAGIPVTIAAVSADATLQTIGGDIHLTTSSNNKAYYNNSEILTEASVVDSLESTSTTAPLSANQGKVLKEMIGSEATTREETFTTLQTSVDNETKAREDADTALQSNIDKKQDKLTAGTGIDITDNVISSTVDTNPFVFVDALPTEGIVEGKIYCIPDPESTEEDNVWDEYTYHDGAWEAMGKYIPKVDLEQYETKDDAEKSHEDLQSNIDKKQDKLTAGEGIKIEDDTISCEVDFSEYDKTADRKALIEDSEDETYVTKMVDAEGNLLLGFKESGEIEVPTGLADDAYALIEALYKKMSDVVPAIQDYGDNLYDKKSDRGALIEASSDDAYIAKLVDGDGNLLQGFTKSGEMEVPSGVTDDAYSLISALYKKLNDVFPTIQDYADRTYEASAVRKALIDDGEDEEYTLKMVDAEGNLLQGFTESGEASIPNGISDDAYSLINAIYNKMCDMSDFIKELKERIDDMN